MKSDAAHPGNAVILYREETSDDNSRHRLVYVRIKILTDRGREQANVRIPYGEEFGISDVRGRTISPDGSITPLSDKPHDVTLFKGAGRRIKAKTFAMPNAQIGSIIEYKYTEYWDAWLISPHWVIQEELPQLRARFTFIPYHGTHDIVSSDDEILNRVFSFTSGNMPKDAAIKRTRNDDMELEMRNIPAFMEEDMAPPSDLLKMRVDFYYGNEKMMKPEDYWKDQGKRWSRNVEKFIGRSQEVAAAARAAITPADTPEQKARKIYVLVQSYKNTSFVPANPEDVKSKGREDTAADILARKAGAASDLTRLFVAMVRAVDVPAYVMRVADREQVFFQKELPNKRQLTDEIAIVRMPDGKEVFLDPGTPFCPHGLLNWKHTKVQGLRQTGDGGTLLAETPAPRYTEAVTQRVARLRLSADGGASGKIKMVWMGQEALLHRVAGLKTDDAGRNKDLEDELRAMLPNGASVKVESAVGWDNADSALSATFNVEIPSLGSTTGKRLLVPAGLFESNSKRLFAAEERKYPVYLSYPYRTLDDIQFTYPEDFRLESLPQAQPLKTDFAVYNPQRKETGNTIILSRDFAIAGFGFPLQAYPQLRKLYGEMNAADSQQLVLTAAK